MGYATKASELSQGLALLVEEGLDCMWVEEDRLVCGLLLPATEEGKATLEAIDWFIVPSGPGIQVWAYRPAL